MHYKEYGGKRYNGSDGILYRIWMIIFCVTKPEEQINTLPGSQICFIVLLWYQIFRQHQSFNKINKLVDVKNRSAYFGSVDNKFIVIIGLCYGTNVLLLKYSP